MESGSAVRRNYKVQCPMKGRGQALRFEKLAVGFQFLAITVLSPGEAAGANGRGFLLANHRPYPVDVGDARVTFRQPRDSPGRC
jgi:hypothetical protein